MKIAPLYLSLFALSCAGANGDPGGGGDDTQPSHSTGSDSPSGVDATDSTSDEPDAGTVTSAPNSDDASTNGANSQPNSDTTDSDPTIGDEPDGGSGNSEVQPSVDVSKSLSPAQQAELSALSLKLEEASALSVEGLLEKRALDHTTLSYDPKAAEFMDLIQDSALALNDSELDKLGENGFVISTRQAFPTFVRGYAAIYSEDLPVYISADGILEALHSSYDELLKLTEQEALIGMVDGLLGNLHAALGSQSDVAEAASLDLYLSVARSLLSGSAVAPMAGADTVEIADWLAAAHAAEGMKAVTLFGVPRNIDTSQFKPRGHYTDSPELERYFRAMMWLGRIDFRVIETLPNGTTELRRPQFDAMVVLRELMSPADRDTWARVDQALEVFIGPSDYMVAPEVDPLVEALGGYDSALTASDGEVRTAIEQGGYGIQRIASHIMVNDGTVKTLPLNRSFALFGQRYIIDSHVFSQVVYDRTADRRMMPNPLDVAYAALGNDGALPLLQGDLSTYSVDYPGKLEGARILSDEHDEEFWNSNLYNLWLGSLRALSPGEDVSNPSAVGMPEVTGTEAWNRRILNTQLASWAELRHDTLLYAKQSYTGVPACEYPDAYVDPYPEFFATLMRYADVGAALANDLGSDLGYAQESVTTYFQNLKSSMTMLESMARSQRDGVPFTEAEMAFINDAVRIEQQDVVCATVPAPDGWLSDLYLISDNAIEFDPTIADVHTQPADEVGNPVGKVLHVGTGYPRLMVTTIDTCQGPRAYAGVTFAYHEQVTSDFERLTDEDWSSQLGAAPAADVPWMAPVLSE